MTTNQPNYPLCFGLKYTERSLICTHCKYLAGCKKAYRPVKN